MQAVIIQRRIESLPTLSRSGKRINGLHRLMRSPYLFERAYKTRILEAVREAKGEAAAQLIDHLKKSEMAREAERLLGDTRWLPEPLRLFEVQLSSDVNDGSAQPLPEFLSGDEEETSDVGEGEHSHAVAAE